MKLGLITYATPHLKTNQLAEKFLIKGYELSVFALPFVQRKPREVLFKHRPDQNVGVHPEVFCKSHGIEYTPCERDADIPNCDVEYFIIAGASILSPECVRGKRIINSHPGVIPAARGLDSFKWSILRNIPLGNTLHFIDEEVDQGEIISVLPTPIYPTDTLEALAQRHYENEIYLMAEFEYFLNNPSNPFEDIEEQPACMRMPREIEQEMMSNFPS